MKHIHMLTGLRGLAVLIVFISHSANVGALPAVFGEGFGQIGVMLFFVLSGFLMAHLYVKEEFDFVRVRRYALARIGRVVPLYLAVLLVSVAVSNFLYEGYYYSFTEFQATFLAFTFAKAPYELWTIPVEVQFYCLFVGFWFLYKRKYGLPVLLGFVFLTFVPAVFLLLVFHKFPKTVSVYSFSFFIGVFTALRYDKMRHSHKLRQVARYAGLPLFLMLFINLPVLRLEYGLVYDDWMHLRTWGDPITWIIVYGVFFCALLNSPGLFFLNWRPFVFLGMVSYGFYLIHKPVLVHLGSLDMPGSYRVVLALAITLLLSYLSFRYFEKPVSKRIRNI